MNDKYSVILKLVWYNENGHPHFYNYTCKHIIGGLKELVFNLEFDKEYFSYAIDIRKQHYSSLKMIW